MLAETLNQQTLVKHGIKALPLHSPSTAFSELNQAPFRTPLMRLRCKVLLQKPAAKPCQTKLVQTFAIRPLEENLLTQPCFNTILKTPKNAAFKLSQLAASSCNVAAMVPPLEDPVFLALLLIGWYKSFCGVV